MQWSKKFLGKILDFCLLFIKKKQENDSRSIFEGYMRMLDESYPSTSPQHLGLIQN